MSLTNGVETVAGFALLTMDWDVVLTVPLPEPYEADIASWRIEEVRVDTEPVGEWTAWRANIPAPVFLDQVALLREDRTPIDSRALDSPIPVPAGHYVIGVHGHLWLEVAP